jgi:hypothetical protein
MNSPEFSAAPGQATRARKTRGGACPSRNAMKKTHKRLALRAETVRTLQSEQLGAVAGGLGVIIIPKTQYTCEILRCIPNSDRSVCELCVVQ